MILSLSATALPQARSKSTKKAPVKKAAKKVVAKKPTTSNALKGEVSLIGIRLMDDGMTILNRFGSPDDIQAVGGGAAGSIGPAGGAARGGGPGGVPGGPGGGRPGGGGGSSQEALSVRPGDFQFGDDLLLQGPQRAGASGGPSPVGGPGPGAASPDQPQGAGGASMGASGGGDRILYTRWVYKRGAARYGFVLNRFNKIVQIEAIGMNDGKVRTARGLTFGASFANIQRKYGAPDGYEINGDSLVVRYLVRNKVAFRMSRLAPNKPHVVTGIVVAGGKL